MAKQDDWIRITLRLPNHLNGKLALAAETNSMNVEIVQRLEQLFEEQREFTKKCLQIAEEYEAWKVFQAKEKAGLAWDKVELEEDRARFHKQQRQVLSDEILDVASRRITPEELESEVIQRAILDAVDKAVKETKRVMATQGTTVYDLSDKPG